MRAKNRRLLLITTWADDGRWYFLNRLRQLGAQVDVLEPPFLRCRWAPQWLKRFSSKHCAMYQSCAVLMRGQRYDAVATWNTRTGTTLGVLSRLIPRRRRARHILRDFHLDLTRFADPVYFVRIFLVKLAVPGVDAFLTTSKHEADLYGGMFRIPAQDIIFFPDTPGSAYMEEHSAPQGDYIFSYGNSDRDFDTLIQAAEKIPRHVVILSQKFTPRGHLPGNVTFITRRLPLDELMGLIAGAAAVVIPIKSHFVAAGQNAMLEVMCQAKPLVVTANLTTLEHATHGRDALFCPPRDSDALAADVNKLLDDPEFARGLGKKARETALHFPEMQVDIFLDVLDRLQARQEPSQSGAPGAPAEGGGG